MADSKISALPASTTPLAGTEVLPIVQSSTTKQVSIANLTAGRTQTSNGIVQGTAATGYNFTANTPAAGMTSQLLNSYEEGSWTPILADTGLIAKGATYSLALGRYTRIGNRVSITCFISMASLGTLTTSDPAFILGLPYASNSTSGNISSCSIGFATNLNLAIPATLNFRIGSNESAVTLSQWTSVSTTGNTSLTVAEVSADGILVFSAVYLV